MYCPFLLAALFLAMIGMRQPGLAYEVPSINALTNVRWQCFAVHPFRHYREHALRIRDRPSLDPQPGDLGEQAPSVI
jgi:hypothetical protein